MMLRLLPLLLLLSAGACCCHGAAAAWWRHDWSAAQAMQFIDFGYQLMTDAQAAFVAGHYRVVSIEKCTGFWDRPSRTTEQAFIESAARLKRHDPSVRTLLYWDTDQGNLQCYAGAAALLARPDWWLRGGASGAVLYTDAAGTIPYLNTSVPEGRAWWIGVPMAVLAAANGTLLDGVLADGTGSGCPGGLTAGGCAAYVEGKRLMVSGLCDALANATGGRTVVVGNGLNLYSPADDNELDTLAGMDGIMLEHFAVFEQVLLPDGALNVPLVAEALLRVAEAAATGAAVVMACWPGPYTDAFDAHGFPGWAGNNNNNRSAPTTNEGWRAALLQYAPFALAAFLTVAEANVFMQYQAWYNGFSQGAIPCDAAPSTCAAPLSTAWYPEWSRPIGPPLGPAVRVGNVWTRNFTLATSVLDLDAPLAGSRVVFFAPANQSSSNSSGSLATTTTTMTLQQSSSSVAIAATTTTTMTLQQSSSSVAIAATTTRTTTPPSATAQSSSRRSSVAIATTAQSSLLAMAIATTMTTTPVSSSSSLLAMAITPQDGRGTTTTPTTTVTTTTTAPPRESSSNSSMLMTMMITATPAPPPAAAGLSTGAIIGVAVGGGTVVVLAVVAVAAMLLSG